MRPIRPWKQTLLAAFVALIGEPTRAADPASRPFVASFERFAGDATAPANRLSDRDAGRLLVAELGCTACHAGPASLAAKAGPDLSGVGERLRIEWIRDFLHDPAAVAPGTTMPHPLASLDQRERASAVADLAAHLGTLRKPVPLPKPGGLNPMPPQFHELGDADRGGRLYHRVGCVACHDPFDAATASPIAPAGLDPEDLTEAGLPIPEPAFPSAPLSRLREKYTLKSLTEFLVVPLHARPSGRMPDLRLKAAEAADIAAALLARDPSDPPTSPSPIDADANAERGSRLFADLRCAACHSGEQTPAPSSARPPDLASVDPLAANACIAPVPPDGGDQSVSAPWYPLDDVQRRAIIAALLPPERAESPTRPVDRSAAIDAVDLSMMRLGCLACHEREGRGGVGTNRRAFFETVDLVDLGDEGRLPPSLTGVGARLRREWLAKAIAGSVTLRPFMHARMPLFPGEAIEGLAAGLVAADRPAAPIEGEPSGLHGNDLIEAGARLLDLGCIQCHPLGSHALPGTVGVNLEGVAGRVDPDWFRRLLRDPASVRPGTKMPAFFGQTVNRSILDGDAERQIAAIWAYLDRDRLEPLPARLLSSPGDFELVPMKEPIVFRTFMRRAGTHAIALGFPQGVHLAFDADHCRLSEAWRGRFLDARGTWVLAKSAPPADPLGGDRITIDRVAPLATLSERSSPWPSTVADVAFLGYVLDDRGVPTFRHRIAGRTILERIVPIEEPRPSSASGSPAPAVGLVRQLSLEAVGRTDREADDAEIWLCVVAGRSIEVDGSSARCADDSPPFEATVRWTTPGSSATTSPDLGVVREVSAEGVERAWTVPLPGDGASLEVIYRW